MPSSTSPFPPRLDSPQAQQPVVGHLLLTAAKTIDSRQATYGDPLTGMRRAAQLASLKLGREISPYDVAVVLESVKDARRSVSPEHEDSHNDGIAYRAIAAALRGERVSAGLTAVPKPDLTRVVMNPVGPALDET